MEVKVGLEPTISILQTDALPLGYITLVRPVRIELDIACLRSTPPDLLEEGRISERSATVTLIRVLESNQSTLSW